MENVKSQPPISLPAYMYCVPIFPLKRTGKVASAIFGIFGLIGILLAIVYLIASFFHDFDHDVSYAIGIVIFGGTGFWCCKKSNDILTEYRVCPVCNTWIERDQFKGMCPKCGAEEAKPFVPRKSEAVS